MKFPPTQPSPRRRRSRYRSPSLIPWSAAGVCLLFYALAGLLLGAVSPPYWVWPLAMAGALLQSVAMCGMQALAALAPPQARRAFLLGALGSLCLVVALAIAANYAGAAPVETTSLQITLLSAVLSTLLALALAGLCTFAAAWTGDWLLAAFGRSRSGLMVAALCFLGLFLGGLLGFAITAL
ncbi:MAG: hypothetical protein F6J97_08515 [Leptolyngbya sp. SIO4C1]|nr:hypothetical protein [Leptolyngbya sp. SIO4C1]